MALWKGIQAMNKRTLNDFSCNFKHVFVWAMLTLQYTAGGNSIWFILRFRLTYTHMYKLCQLIWYMSPVMLFILISIYDI